MGQNDQPQNNYIFNPEHAGEIARLVLKNQLYKKVLGAPFPEQEAEKLTEIHQVLDVGCGPAGWALDVASTYNHMHVVGIDLNEVVVKHARNEAQQLGLKNIEFIRMNALQKRLDFQDAHFDLINMHSAATFIRKGEWQPLLQECYRITRLGGIIRITHADRAGLTNSLAFEKYHLFCSQALYRMGYGFSPDGYTLGITPMLGQLLQDAGYKAVQMKPYVLDFSYDSPFNKDYRQNINAIFKQIQALFKDKNIELQPEIEEYYDKSLKEMRRDVFCGLQYQVVAWSEK